MRDIREIRRQNARAILAEEFKDDVPKFAAKIEVQPAFVYRLLSPNVKQPRNIGDKLARKIEIAGKRPPNWLDQEQRYRELPPPVPTRLSEMHASSAVIDREVLKIAAEYVLQCAREAKVELDPIDLVEIVAEAYELALREPIRQMRAQVIQMVKRAA